MEVRKMKQKIRKTNRVMEVLGALVVMMFIFSLVPMVAAEETEGNEANDAGVSEGSVDESANADIEVKADVNTKGKFKNNLKQRMQDKKMDPEKKEKLEARIRNLQAIQTKAFEKIPEEKLRKLKFQAKDIGLEFFQKLDQREAEVLAHLDRSKLKNILTHCENDVEKCKKELASLKLKKLEKQVGLTAQDVKKARLRFVQAKKKFTEAEASAKTAKTKFLELKKEGASDEELLESGKEFVIHSAERLQAHLRKVLEKVQENNPERSAVDELESAISALDEIIETTKVATTKEEVREQAKKVKRLYTSLKHRLKVHAQRALNGAAHKTYNHVEKAVDVFECAEESLNGQVDTTELEASINAIVELQAEANGHYETANKLFDKARSTDDKDEAIRAITAARKELRSGLETIKEITVHLQAGIRFVNANNPGLLGECRQSLHDEQPEYEVVEEDEEEVEEAVVDVETELGSTVSEATTETSATANTETSATGAATEESDASTTQVSDEANADGTASLQ